MILYEEFLVRKAIGLRKIEKELRERYGSMYNKARLIDDDGVWLTYRLISRDDLEREALRAILMKDIK